MNFVFRNVNDAYQSLMNYLLENTSETGVNSDELVMEGSRNGPVIRFRRPVTITYTNPRERVLFDPVRDANPFFHLYESLWMLGGRNDVESLAHFVPRMKDFSDDGKTLNGAYGYRWRSRDIWARIVDQLNILVDHLKTNPNSRRAVLEMWNVEDDLLKIDTSKDVCCNLSVCFEIRKEVKFNDTWVNESDYLDMTVFNRSNDMILGMFGANLVHFSVLQEYMAMKIGCKIGEYHQITKNLHVYQNEPKFKAALEAGLDGNTVNPYGSLPMEMDSYCFDDGLNEFLSYHPSEINFENHCRNNFIDMAYILCAVFNLHKQKKTIEAIEKLKANNVSVCPFWFENSLVWLERRVK